MAGILPTFGNIGITIASLYPIFIVSFLVLASIFNLKLNGLIYLLGILITFVICRLLAILPMGEERDRLAPVTCDFISTLGYNYKSPSFQAAVTWFTFIYLLIPMLQNITLLNPVVVIFTSVLAIVNMMYLYTVNCSSIAGLLFGAILGSVIGSIWFGIIWSSNKDLLFYNELISNNVVCKKPSNQTFKCHIYKNGEIISSSVV